MWTLLLDVLNEVWGPHSIEHLDIASAAFLRSDSHGAHEHILFSLFLSLRQPEGPGSCIYFPQEEGSIGFKSKSKSKLYYDQWSVGQSVLVSGTHLGPATNFPPSLVNYF
jgi:hypothetical protein